MLEISYNYLRAGIIPHLLGVVLAVASYAAWRGLAGGGSALLAALAAGCGLGALSCEIECVSRYREYVWLRSLLRCRGFYPMALRMLGTSHCQRHAALCAARDAGLGEQARRYYHERGYRWFHLLPDRMRESPLRILDIPFLRATFYRASLKRRRFGSGQESPASMRRARGEEPQLAGIAELFKNLAPRAEKSPPTPLHEVKP